MALPPIEYTGREDIRGGMYLPSQLEHNAVNFTYRTSPSPSAVNLKGPKHDQVESGFFLHKSDPYGFLTNAEHELNNLKRMISIRLKLFRVCLV
jgi:hypothetical protein